MKVYVLTNGSFVVSVRKSEEEARRSAETSLKSLSGGCLETEWRRTIAERYELFYKPARSGRWNSSRLYVTVTDLNT